MEHLPSKIEVCPIEEAIFEIRYKSKYPDDAIFGMLYAKIERFFSGEPRGLPILQLPESVRSQDPNLRYQAHHRLVKDNFTLNIGPKVLTFSNSKPYSGWGKWSGFFYDVLDNIVEENVLGRVERIGLRYVNVFNDGIFDKVKFEVKVNNKLLVDESTNLRTEILDEGFVKVLQIGNSVTLIKDAKELKGSIIDIDCMREIPESTNFGKNYRQIVENAHDKEKELFFSLLEDSFLEELKPNFGG